MKAWQVRKHGGVEALERVELPTPVAGPLQARIRVQAVGLNHLDLWLRKGVPGYKFPLPLIPGCDMAGIVDELGPGASEALRISGISIGSEVIVSPGFSCGRCEACLGGFDPLCKQYGIPGETQNGGCSDYFIAPIANLISRPQNLTPAQAGAIGIPFLTAWTMLVRKAELKPGERVLIHAGGSGVSMAAIQIAKLFGATVITTVGSDEKVAKAKTLGADHVINYRKENFREAIKKITRSGCEVVVDHVGAETMSDSLKCLAWGGRLVTCGATSGAEISVDLKTLFFKNISVLGSTMGSKADLIRIVELIHQGKLSPVIDSEFSMEDLPKAHEKLESRAVFGKIVVTQ